MSTLFPVITNLNLLQEFHDNYANGLMKIILIGLKEENIELGECRQGDKKWSELIFSEGDLDNAELILRYGEDGFELLAITNEFRNWQSQFSYFIETNSLLYKEIPESLRQDFEDKYYSIID